MLTQETLKGILHYNPDTGLFTWLVDRGSNKTRGTTAGSIDSKKGYVRIGISGKNYLAHRLAFLYMKGYIPKYVDHKDTNGANNKWCNLRECTQSQNLCNTKASRGTTSGVKGVTYHKPSGKWKASITFQGVTHSLRYHDTIEQAAEAVQLKRVELHGEFVNHG